MGDLDNWGWLVSWSWMSCRGVGSNSFICDISNIAIVVVSVVLDMLHTTIRQEDTGSYRCEF